MALYECEVYNCYSLNIRSGPSMGNVAVRWLQRGDRVLIESEVNGWYKIQGLPQYGYKDYLKIIRNLDLAAQPKPIYQSKNNTSNVLKSVVSKVGINPSTSVESTVKKKVTKSSSKKKSSNGKNVNIDDDLDSKKLDKLYTSKAVDTVIEENMDFGLFYLSGNEYYKLYKNKTYKTTFTEQTAVINKKGNVVQDENNAVQLKKVKTKKTYKYQQTKTGEDAWLMKHNKKMKFYDKNTKKNINKSLTDILDIIDENLNIPSAYTRNEINQHLHINFNRFKIDHPDTFIKNTMGVVIFTRPDLNIFTSDGKINSMISRDPRDNLIVNTHKDIAQLLTLRYDGDTVHKFNPLLSNLAQSLEIIDDHVDTLTTGETYTGYKMQYSKHNIGSITSGTFTIKYQETFDRAVTDMHQLWVDYQSNVYRGIYEPNRKYIYKKELDYACDVYYFLLDQDCETILFWSKYYGVFPHNVPKSVYSFDFGSRVSLPELSVTYSYIYKEDLSPVALKEFNMNALGDKNGNASGQEYVLNYNKNLIQSNITWVGTPFVHSFFYDNGMQKNVQGFKLGWQKKKSIRKDK